MMKPPRRLDGESPERSANRKVRWLSELCSHPAIWAGVDRAWLSASGFSEPHWSECPPCMDRCHLSSPDSSSHRAARNHVLTGQRAGAAAYVPGTSKAPVPGGAEAGGVPPVGLEPTTFGLKVRRPVIVWIEYIGVLATHWLTMRATVSRQSLPHQLAQLAYHDPTAARLPLD